MSQALPLSDFIFAEPVEEKSAIPGGFIIPDSAKQKIRQALVLSVGPGNSDYKMQSKPGDILFFNENRSTTFEFEGKKYIAIREQDCFGKVSK